MLRFDAKLGIYVYPEAGDEPNLQLAINRGSTYENNVTPRSDLSVVKYGFHIPQKAASYGIFERQMKEEEKRFRAGIYLRTKENCS